MKVHQLIITVVDFDELGADGVVEALLSADYPNRCINPSVRKVETRDIGPWSDEHPLNNRNTAAAELTRLFGPLPTNSAQGLITGALFKNFFADEPFWGDRYFPEIMEIKVNGEGYPVSEDVADIPDDAKVELLPCFVLDPDSGADETLPEMYARWLAIQTEKEPK